MELTILERLILSNLLPAQGNFVNLKLLRVVRENLSFTEEENKLLNFRQEGDQMKWNDGVVADKEIEIGEVVTQIIVKELKKLNDEEGLQNEQLSVYEKFVDR